MVKAVSFKQKEVEMINFIEGKDFSYYVKDLIKKDMNKEEKQDSSKKEETHKPRRNANFYI